MLDQQMKFHMLFYQFQRLLKPRIKRRSLISLVCLINMFEDCHPKNKYKINFRKTAKTEKKQ